MKLYAKLIIFIVMPLLVLGCSEGAGQRDEASAVPQIAEDIVGSWTSTSEISNATWQFFADGTFIDTENAVYGYQIQIIEEQYYIAFRVEELGIELTDEVREELERSLGSSEYVPIYEAIMPSQNSLVLEPATRLYGTDEYFGSTFETLVLRRQ